MKDDEWLLASQFDRVRIKVRIRRDLGLRVKPEAECLDGWEGEAEVWWMQSEEAGDRYPGEWAIGLPDSRPGFPHSPSWIASGDAVMLERIEGVGEGVGNV
jgi:hypothetical protein